MFEKLKDALKAGLRLGKMSVRGARDTYVGTDRFLRLIRAPLRASMLLTVPAAFAATFYGFDPALRFYEGWKHPAPVVVFDLPAPQPPSAPLQLVPAKMAGAVQPPTPEAPPASPPPPQAAPPVRDTSRQHPGHVVNGVPVDDQPKRHKTPRKPKPVPRPTPAAGFYPLNQYPLDPDAPTTGGLY